MLGLGLGVGVGVRVRVSLDALARLVHLEHALGRGDEGGEVTRELQRAWYILSMLWAEVRYVPYVCRFCFQ